MLKSGLSLEGVVPRLLLNLRGERNPRWVLLQFSEGNGKRFLAAPRRKIPPHCANSYFIATVPGCKRVLRR